jgi:hypothetical protein
MSRPMPSDATLKAALAASLPPIAPPDLRERILDQARTTTQQHRLSGLVAPLGDPRVSERRQALLLIAILLLVAALVATATAGALLEQRRQRLPIGPPGDPTALANSVGEAYARVPAMALAVNWTSHSTGIHVAGLTHHWADGTGRFRLELNDRDETIYITTGSHIWIRYRLDGPETWADNRGPYADHGGVGDLMLDFRRECGPGWSFGGTDLILGRPAFRLVCGAQAFWIDSESLLVLRLENGTPDPSHPGSLVGEVVALHFGPQSPDLFELPAGAAVDPRPPKAGAATPSVEGPSALP